VCAQLLIVKVGSTYNYHWALKCYDFSLDHFCIQTRSEAHTGSIPISVKLTTLLHLLTRLRMCGAVPPLPIRLHTVVLN
jgi:hypothetical protein